MKNQSTILDKHKKSKSKVTCERPENSGHIIHSPGWVPDDSCFMAFPMRQDSMWVSSVWCRHCVPAREDHPHEVKYCPVATSHFPAHRVNCGWTAEQRYLSLCPDPRHSLEAESAAILLCSSVSRLQTRQTGVHISASLQTCFNADGSLSGEATISSVTGWRLQLPVLFSQDIWQRALWERGPRKPMVAIM